MAGVALSLVANPTPVNEGTNLQLCLSLSEPEPPFMSDRLGVGSCPVQVGELEYASWRDRFGSYPGPFTTPPSGAMRSKISSWMTRTGTLPAP